MFVSSVAQVGGAVVFPSFVIERLYQYEVDPANVVMPEGFERWAGVVGQMLSDAGVRDTAYVMIHASNVEDGESQRRGGVHIDGPWQPALSCHGVPSHGSVPPSHGPTPRHGSVEAGCRILMASNVVGCVGYVGQWDGEVKDGGDCSDIDLTGLNRVELQSHVAYVGNTAFLHESVPIEGGCERQLVRINAPTLN